MAAPSFATLYRQLNPAQRRAVDTIEGPVMVVAGPGTGKTQVLTLRIANILRRTDIAPENILALAFTESAVVSMRRRLAEIIGSPAYAVVINTFHGFCNEIIRTYPEEFPRIIGSTSITEVDQIELLQEAIRALTLKELKPFGDPHYYLRPVLQRINDLKREGVSPERFRDIVAQQQEAFLRIEDLYYEHGRFKGRMRGPYQKLERRIAKNRELADIYAWYEERLAQGRLYDYSDMIMEALKALQGNRDLLLILQEQYQYVLVDEHQDTNNAQNRILELLMSFHENPNLFVVGDEKQAIFRFQGASLENFAYFRKRYPGADMIILEENYRSEQPLLDAAEQLLPSRAPLRAARRSPDAMRIVQYAFSRPEAEAYFLAQDIRDKIELGVPPHDIAVLYRDNRDAFPIADMLAKTGIPHAIESDQDILGDADIRKLVALFRAVNEFGSEERFLEALHVDFLGVEPLDLYRLARARVEGRTSVFALARSPEHLLKLQLESADAIHDAYRKLAQWAKAHRHLALTEFFEIVVRESGFLPHILGDPDPLDRMETLESLFSEVRMLVEKHKDADLPAFLAYLDTLAEHGILVEKRSFGHVGRRVRLMTAHRSKGLEFRYVYIINATDGHWGNRRRPDLLPLLPHVYALTDAIPGEGNTIDDERRLFYVALTRAKEHAVITYARRGADGREQLPSQFLQEIRPDAIDAGDAGPWERGFAERKEILFAPALLSGVDLKDRDFIKETFVKNGLSVTALNNYLECPWKYFYTNLLRVPKARTKHQMYGTAVHEALRDFFDARKDREVGKEFLLAKFRHYLVAQPLTQHDFDEALRKGETALAGYHETYAGTWRANTLNEFKIAGVLLREDLRLTGILDKMEFLDDAGAVNIVDYKTGRPKSRREIEGATKNSRGDLKRQIVFYRLLLDRYDNEPSSRRGSPQATEGGPPSRHSGLRPREGGRYRMASADIDFVEPDRAGRYRKERFVIVDDDVRELEALVRETADDILNVRFWERRCGEKDCAFCALREMMGR